MAIPAALHAGSDAQLFLRRVGYKGPVYGEIPFLQKRGIYFDAHTICLFPKPNNGSDVPLLLSSPSLDPQV